MKSGFDYEQKTIQIINILPTKLISEKIKNDKKYEQIRLTIKEFGLIEPMVVFPDKGQKGQYILLDGHLRFEILKEIGEVEAICMVATDDETFTFNNRVNRTIPIQEHYMVLRALKGNVSEDRLARIFGIDVPKLRRSKNLLKDICPEVEDMMKLRNFPAGAIRVVSKMKPIRQIEVVKMMISANNFTISYAKSMLLLTPDSQKINAIKKPILKGITKEERDRLEVEMQNLNESIKSVEGSYGVDLMELQFSFGYVAKLLENQNIVHFLNKNHLGILTSLTDVMETIANESKSL